MLPFRESIRTPSILFAGLLLASGARAQGPAPAPPAAEKPYKLYGWLQAGFAANFDSPEDRINFGANFDWRSNDFRLNQLNFVFENPLEHEEFNVGYRVDFLVGDEANHAVNQQHRIAVRQSRENRPDIERFSRC